jgi:hypothetical protein
LAPQPRFYTVLARIGPEIVTDGNSEGIRPNPILPCNEVTVLSGTNAHPGRKAEKATSLR